MSKKKQIAVMLGVALIVVVCALGVSMALTSFHSGDTSADAPALQDNQDSQAIDPSSADAAQGGAPASQADSEADTQQDAAAISQYRNIVASAASMAPFVADASPTGTYWYALVTLQPNEGPSLLLAQETANMGQLIRVYYYDEDSGTLYDTGSSYKSSNDTGAGEAYIQMGAASGGFRSSVSVEPDGNGLMCAQWSSGTGEGEVLRYTRSGDALANTEEQSFSLAKGTQVPSGTTIQWHDASDTSALDGWPAEVAATGDDGFPASDSVSTSSATTGSDAAASDPVQSDAQSAQKSVAGASGISGTYRDASGNTQEVVDNGDGTITLANEGGSSTLTYDASTGRYSPDPTVTGAVYFDTSTSPITLHVMGDMDYVYTKVG